MFLIKYAYERLSNERINTYNCSIIHKSLCLFLLKHTEIKNR
jgi:hypothetical protein